MMGNRINIVVKDGSKMLKYGQKVKIDESFDGSFTYSVCEMNVKCQFIKKTNQPWIALFKQIKIPNCEIIILSNYEIYIAYVYQLTNSQLANKALSSPIIVSGESNSMKYEMIFSFNPENVYKTLNKIKKGSVTLND